MAGVLTSIAVSQRSSSSSTIRAWGRRMANDLALACPKPEALSRDRPEGGPDPGTGDDVPGEGVDEGGGPIAMPLYSAAGMFAWSPVSDLLRRASRASRTLTMA